VNGASLRTFLAIARLFSHAPASRSFSHAPASHSFPDDQLKFSVTIAAIDEGEVLSSIGMQVRAAAKPRELQDHIRRALKARVLIGETCYSPLEIVPLQQMWDLDDVKKHNLTDLRTGAQQLDSLPRDTALSGIFTAQPDYSDRIHFLVWLPPEDREFLLSNPSST
jgi:hypothetical protein